MAIAELLSELSKPAYVGLSDADRVAALNAKNKSYVPCPIKALAKTLDGFALAGRVAVAHSEKIVDDDLYARWITLEKAVANPNIDTIMFNVGPLLIEDMFDQLLSLGVIEAIEHLRVIDLGTIERPLSRKVFARDVTEADLAAAAALAALDAKVKAQRDAVEAEYLVKIAQVQAAHDELQKQDGSLNPIGNPAFKPAWEK